MRKLKLLALILLSLSAISCSPAISVSKLGKLPPAGKRPIDVRCCIVEAVGRFVIVPEDIALKYYAPADRFYFMNGHNWGDLLKNTSELRGTIRQYELYPCVE